MQLSIWMGGGGMFVTLMLPQGLGEFTTDCIAYW
jgi:hypothetical protein